MLNCAHDQLSVFDPFNTDQPVAEFDQFMGIALYSDGFQAIVMIEMNVLDREYLVMEIMLDAGGFVLQFPFVVVVDQDDRAGDLTVFFPFLFGQVLLDHESDRLGTVGEMMLFDKGIKGFHQILIKGNTKSFGLHVLRILKT
jgi:hypothetical protein